ncbi:MAG: 2'-5' RNA ligase family protein [Candidatus Andersenbacteria bacterium]|nr:2'-5' RNA ligase family protein [Candidatus Andersenbacteria bacterium]
MPTKRDTMAVDIVLLLPPRITNLALQINRSLETTDKPIIKLGRLTCVPHITLVMGCIPATALPSLKRSLRTLARRQSSLPLTITALASQPSKPGNKIYTLNIAKNDDLQMFHEQVVALIQPYTTLRATVTSLHPNAPPDPVAAKWVNNYIKTGSLANYWPHITVGMGRIKTKLPSPVSFTAARLGLCHIGHVGTCYRLLWQSRLKK